MTRIFILIDELLSELEAMKRPTQDMEIGLFIIDLKFRKAELQRLYK